VDQEPSDTPTPPTTPTTPPTTTQPSTPEAPAARPRRRLWWGLLGGAGVLLLAGYAAAVLLVGDTLPRGSSVSGVAVGGLTRDEAEDRLEYRLAARADRPLTLVADDGADDGAEDRAEDSGEFEQEVSPADAGLSVDAAASVAQVAGGSRWSPQGLWGRLTGGADVDAVVDVDGETLDALLEQVDEQVATEPVDGAVRLTRKGVRTTDAEPGTAVDADGAREALLAAYPGDAEAEGSPEVDLPLTDVAPDVDQDAVDRAVEEFAEPALSGPVTISFQGSEVTLDPTQYARALVLEPEGDELAPRLRPRPLHALLDSLVVSDGQAPVDASVTVVRGEPQVVPGKPGVSYDRAQVDDRFLDLVVAPEGERSLEVAAAAVEPAFTTADAEALGVTERVSSFTTYFPYAEYRNVNIGRAGELVDGTLVAPGETFSLNETVGERTAENGFTEGFVISDGIFKEDLGGGVSQMATTVFNAAFFGGMTDVEHKPHSFYIDRYPVGREATVAWPVVDLRWRNDTPYGVLVQARVTPSTPSSQGEATVSLYSTKYWDITSDTGPRYNPTSPATRILDTPDCYPNSGYGGFDVDVTRYWRKAGSDVLERTEVLTTTYTPSDTVVCRPPGSLDEGAGTGVNGDGGGAED